MRLFKDNFKLIFVVASMVIIGIGTLVYDINKPSLSGSTEDRFDIFIEELKQYVPNDKSGLTSYDFVRNNDVLVITYSSKDADTGVETNTYLAFSYDSDTNIVSLLNDSNIDLFDDNLVPTNKLYIITLFTQYINSIYAPNANLLSDLTDSADKILVMSKTGINMYFSERGTNEYDGEYVDGLESFEIKLRDCTKTVTDEKTEFTYVDDYSTLYPDAEVSTISIATAENGSLSIKGIKRVGSNDVVTLKSTPSTDYFLKSLTIKDANNTDITSSVGYDKSALTFNMPSSDVTITPVFDDSIYDYSIVVQTTDNTITINKGETVTISPQVINNETNSYVDGFAFTFDVGDSSIAEPDIAKTVESKTLKLTGKTVGKTTLGITSSHQSDAYKTMTKIINIKVVDETTEAKDVTLSASDLTMSVGESKTASISAKVDGDTVAGTYKLTPVTTGVVEVTNTTLKGLKSGSTKVNVEFTPTDTTKYNKATASFTAKVELVKPTVSVDDLTLKVNETKTVTVNSNGVEGTSKLSTSSNYITIDSLKVTGKSIGEATVTLTFTPTDTTKYETVTKTFKVTVSDKTEAPLTVNNVTLNVGETKDLTYNVQGVSGEIEVTSEDKTIATVNNIKVTGVKKGTTKLKVVFTPDDTDKYTTTTKYATVTVNSTEEESEIEEFVSGLKEKYSDADDIKFEYNETTKILTVSYCKNGCSTSNTDSSVKFLYDEKSGILKLANSISLIGSNNWFTNEYVCIYFVMDYINDKYGLDENSFGSIESNWENGNIIDVLTINNNGLIILLTDYKNTTTKTESGTSSYKGYQTLKNYAVDLRNGVNGNSTVYKVNTSSKNGTITVDNVDYVNGKDVITLKATPDTKYGFDSLVIKDSTGKDITKEVNYNSNTMTFEMPSKNVTIEATFITNAKTNVTDVTLLLVLTMSVFAISYYLVRRSSNTIGL